MRRMKKKSLAGTSLAASGTAKAS